MTPIEQILFLLKAVPVTLGISLASFVLGFAIGIPIALLRIYGGRFTSMAADAYEKVFRSIPVLVVMFFMYFGLGSVIHLFKDPYITSVLSLGLVSAANQSQICLLYTSPSPRDRG